MVINFSACSNKTPVVWS